MNRTFVPFDQSYRVPVDIHVSRGVRVGDLLFTCGQLDMDGDGRPQHERELLPQTARAMELLYDVMEKAGARPEDMAHLHVFYRNDGGVDEDDYARRLDGLLRGTRRPLTVLTPIASFPSAGLEVEIDAIAVCGTGARSEVVDDRGRLSGLRRGESIFASATVPREPSGGIARRGDLARQTAGVTAGLERTLKALSADLGDVVKLAVYTASGFDAGAVAESRRILAAAFAEPGPVLTEVLLPRLAFPGEGIRVEATAVRGADGQRLPRQYLRQGDHWSWPSPSPYAQAIRTGRLVFVGAQLPVDRAGRVRHPNDLAAQTHATMAHLGAALGALGAGLEHMAKVNAYFAASWDLERWKTNVGIRSTYYRAPGPASTGIEVPRLVPDGALIEVDCVAVLP